MVHALASVSDWVKSFLTLESHRWSKLLESNANRNISPRVLPSYATLLWFAQEVHAWIFLYKINSTGLYCSLARFLKKLALQKLMTCFSIML